MNKLVRTVLRWFQTPERYERTRTFETLYVDFLDPSTGKSGDGEGLDISVDSIRFAAFQQFKKNTVLDLTLRFSYNYTETRSVKMKATVIESKRHAKQKRHRTVCVFQAPADPEDLKEIERLIQWLKEVKEKYLFFRYGKQDPKS
ncbi:MAG TPA: hypothetical protein VL688_12830 [Verrucomicrobiae bacterium]|jgi:hypothetical protein|nr:hypothetical protein [Verrucomicrobiae bacterium]